jgi:hypothetical protein
MSDCFTLLYYDALLFQLCYSRVFRVRRHVLIALLSVTGR